MKDEVAQGIKNAMERGQSLESAIASFINAGYSSIEVHQAAESLNNSASSLLPLQQASADYMGTPDTPYQKPEPSSPSPTPVQAPVSAPISPSPAVSPVQKPSQLSQLLQFHQSSQSSQSLPLSKPSEPNQEGGVSKVKVIVLSAILLLLLIGLAASIFFKDAIAALIG